MELAMNVSAEIIATLLLGTAAWVFLPPLRTASAKAFTLFGRTLPGITEEDLEAATKSWVTRLAVVWAICSMGVMVWEGRTGSDAPEAMWTASLLIYMFILAYMSFSIWRNHRK